MISVAGGLAIGALIIFAAQLLPVSTSGYARDKSSYLALLVFPLVLAAATPWLHHSSSAVVRWTELTAVAFVLISLPLTGGGLSWAGELEGHEPNWPSGCPMLPAQEVVTSDWFAYPAPNNPRTTTTTVNGGWMPSLRPNLTEG